MRKLFNSAFRVTQPFEVNASYYKQFGLAGHEGLDCVPTSSSWDVLALADGVVVKDDDVAGNPKSDAYGISVTIWHPTLNRATQYCHLASNTVSLNQSINAGQKIGVMGATGNANGAHVHLNLFVTDTNGIRQNRDNGFLGGIDPLPFLNEGGDGSMTEELKACLADREKFWTERDEAYREIETLKGTIANLNDILGHKDREITELTAQKKTVEAERDEAKRQVKTYKADALKLPAVMQELSDTKESRQGYIDENVMLSKAIEERDGELKRLEDDALALLIRKIMRVIRGGEQRG